FIAPYHSLLTGSWMSGRNTNELRKTRAKRMRTPFAMRSIAILNELIRRFVKNAIMGGLYSSNTAGDKLNRIPQSIGEFSFKNCSERSCNHGSRLGSVTRIEAATTGSVTNIKATELQNKRSVT